MSNTNSDHPIFKLKTIATTLTIATMLIAGCSTVNKDEKELGYDPETRPPKKVQEEIASLSSKVWELSGIKGKASEPGPYVGSCRQDDSSGNLKRVRHPWSLTKVTEREMHDGLDELNSKLAKNGWKVERYGKDKSKNQNLELLAVHVQTRTQLEITALKESDGKPPLFEVTLYSRCFQEPQNSSPEES